MKTLMWKAVLAAGALAFAVSARAEVGELKLMSQYGIGYMQLTVMKGDKLVEKHLAKNGLADTKVTWATLGAGAAANDALLSGSLHMAAGGTGPAFILWDRTRGNVDVRGIAALSSMPNLLVTREGEVKILDMGLARMEQAALADASGGERLTSTWPVPTSSPI